MTQGFESVYLAWRDWRFEWLLSLCAVLALASMLAPILVLQGLKNGIIDGMRERLMEDPTVLIITPKSDAGHFSPETIKEFGALPGAGFIVGRTRDTSADIALRNPANDARGSVALEPSTPGEPVLARYNVSAPQDGEEPELVLSDRSAKAIGAKKGDILEARLGRRAPSGKLEAEVVKLRVADVLPPEAADRKMAFAPLTFMADMENYRDYIAVPGRGWSGEEPKGDRDYSSFRLYANSLDDVESLAAEFANRKIETVTKAREIASIRMLEKSINQVILIISLAVGAGFVAFTISSVQSAVSRKKRMLGMLRLLGFNRGPLMMYPLAQTILTATAGFALSLALYFCVSWGIARAFAGQGSAPCVLTFANVAITLGAALVLSALSCLRAAYEAGAAEPSIVIREV